MKSTALLLVLSAALPLAAETAAPDWSLQFPSGVGPGVLVKVHPYVGDHSAHVTPLPAVEAVYGIFFVSTLDLEGGAMLHKDEKLSVSARLRWNSEGFTASDSAFLVGMNSRRSTLEAGLNGEYDFGPVTSSLSLWQDTLGEHSGQQAAWSLRHTFQPDTSWKITPFASLLWDSSKYANHYFGVRPGEAVVGRPAYEPGSGINYRAGLDLRYEFNSQWNARLAGYAEYLDSDIRNSPIVDRSCSFGYAASVNYRF